MEKLRKAVRQIGNEYGTMADASRQWGREPDYLRNLPRGKRSLSYALIDDMATLHPKLAALADELKAERAALMRERAVRVYRKKRLRETRDDIAEARSKFVCCVVRNIPHQQPRKRW
jgi:hypothetical protein